MSVANSTHPAVTPRSVALRQRLDAGLRPWTLPLLLVGILLGYQVRLESVLVPDMDEGTYLYQGRLMVEGLVPYKDFFIAHPPLVPVYGALVYVVFGESITIARLLYAIGILALASPIYFVVRRNTQSAAAGALGYVTYAAGILAVANMGRTVRLEPVAAGFLVLAFSIAVPRRDEPRWRVVVGALMALALLTKFTSAIPIAIFALYELVEARRELGRLVRPWAAQLLGAAIVLGPSLAYLLSLPDFLNDVWFSQANRPPLDLSLRLAFFGNNLLRFPPLPIALLAAVYFIVRPPTREVRIFSILALGGAFVMVVVMPTYLRFYVSLLMPYVGVVFAIAGWRIVHAMRPSLAPPLMTLGAAVVLLAIFAFGEYFHRNAHQQVSSPARVLPLLKEQPGPFYSMYPSFALQSGVPLTQWTYVADSLLPRVTDQVTPAMLMEIIGRSQSLVIWHGEFDDKQEVWRLIERDFRLEYRDPYWEFWVRR